MRRRRGRPRKAGARERNGRLKRQAETPRQVAATMPHRKGLGEQAADQRAESELGRLVLRGTLTPDQGLAGETYLALWRGYVFSLAGPIELGAGGGTGLTCDGCEVRIHCRCWFRRKVYEEARTVLRRCGHGVCTVIDMVVLHGYPPWNAAELKLLRVGLSTLGQHFGLTPRRNVVSQKISIRTASPPGP